MAVVAGVIARPIPAPTGNQSGQQQPVPARPVQPGQDEQADGGQPQPRYAHPAWPDARAPPGRDQARPRIIASAIGIRLTAATSGLLPSTNCQEYEAEEREDTDRFEGTRDFVTDERSHKAVGALSGSEQCETVPAVGEPSVAARGDAAQLGIDVVVDGGQFGSLLGGDLRQQVGQSVEGHGRGVTGVLPQNWGM